MAMLMPEAEQVSPAINMPSAVGCVEGPPVEGGRQQANVSRTQWFTRSVRSR